MFEKVFSAGRPWVFGHLYLPGGSKSLGAPSHALVSGTQAPLVGCCLGYQGFLFLFGGGGGGGELVGHGTGVQWAGGAMILFVSGLGRLRGAGGLNVFELE